MFNQMNTPFQEVNVAVCDARYLLPERDLLIRLMKRTGSGQRVTIRELAESAGIAAGTVGDLVSGARNRVTYGTAHAISTAIGVDLPILFVPIGRAVQVPSGDITPLPERVAV
ncbi:helix-turn-helix transcriptional regulator [Streptomyces cinnamoneus]|uniref:helix-turn-helix domain-containing protein n=1 Tax=Streptomyces cinnamoneus TaxID=53446 RepID=UPI0033FB98C0